MSNAPKHRKKAIEYEGLKQFDRAVASYVRAIEENESAGEEVDVALFNKVGDLTLRQGRVTEAVTYYERAVEHYVSNGLFDNAIALCNKILRNAPGRCNVYFSLGRICGRKGLRGDATRNFLEYATRMQQEGRIDEAMRALSEVAHLMPELTEVERLVEEHAVRAGIELMPRRHSPALTEPAAPDNEATRAFSMSRNLVFLDIDYDNAPPARGNRSLAEGKPATPNASAATDTQVSALPDLIAGMIFPAAAAGPAGVGSATQGVDRSPILRPYVDLAAPVATLSDLEPTELAGVEARAVETQPAGHLPDLLRSDRASDTWMERAGNTAMGEAVVVPAIELDLPVELLDVIVPAELLGATLPAAVGLESSSAGNPGGLFTDGEVPTAVAAAEATAVASARCAELRMASEAVPNDYLLRRRLAEALFEAGLRDAAIVELGDALAVCEVTGTLPEAADIADELVRVAGHELAHHQKRLELAIRLGDRARLRDAYLDLADNLVRKGEDLRARAVYARVLEIDPWDERARSALGDAAPPPPVKPPTPGSDNSAVSLADWLRDDDDPSSTRLRMREPDVSGDEQDDFKSLLRHFKEGVARSLGEDDYESHYDLGIAYKEMGLLDDAIEEFQMALRGRTNRLAAYEALGQCFIEQGTYKVAVTVLSRALHEPAVEDEQRVGLLYLLGYSCEVLQRFDEARSYFQRVYATDIHFRDVAQRLADLDRTMR